MDVLTVKDVLWAGPDSEEANSILQRAHILRLSDNQILVFGSNPEEIIEGFRDVLEYRLSRAAFYRKEAQAFEESAADVRELIRVLEEAKTKVPAGVPFTECCCCEQNVELDEAVICKDCGKAVHPECREEDDRCSRCGEENENE